jgi:hypothetical protein
MKKAYVEIRNGYPVNMDIQNAIDGLEYLDYDVVSFELKDVLAGNMDVRAKLSPFIGSIDCMTHLFKNINKYPEPIDFPKSIIDSGLLNRDIKIMTLQEAIEFFKFRSKYYQTNIPIFIKPVQTKLFDGILISKEEHLNYFNRVDTNINVLVCEKIDILSEHRAYIHNGKMVYCCNYSGDFRINPDYNYIDSLIKQYDKQPIAYTIDVAVLKDGSNTVIEFNDFWAIGSYGLYCLDYAQMLLDRYFEITSIQK